MILIFGGAYNGKLEFVKENYNISHEDIFICKDSNLDFNSKVICGLHVFIKACILDNINPSEIIKNNLDVLKEKIIICDEIGSGIVPMKALDRKYREECGQALQFLSRKSDKISRIFFGLEEVLK